MAVERAAGDRQTGKKLVADREQELLRRVGRRVREARNVAGLSRREFAERSNVSQRYLAQLESGQGNISIALLSRVASALELPIERLIAEVPAWNREVIELAEQACRATSDQRRAALRLLSSRTARELRAGRIAVIGLRGAGKSTLGRLAAGKLDVPFLELNEEIARVGGMPAEEVIALYGQEGYRHLEVQALEQVAASYDRIVLAVAGGIVSQPETFDFLLANFHTLWLRATPEEHMARVRSQGDERPMAGHPDAMSELRKILMSREAQYARANVQVDTSRKSVAESLADMIGAITAQGFLERDRRRLGTRSPLQ